jgi:hypothetical protein
MKTIDRSRQVLALNNTATTPVAVPAEGASGATIADIYSVVIPPIRERAGIKITANLLITMAAGSTAQAVTIDIRASGQTNAVAEDKTYQIHTTAGAKLIEDTVEAFLPITRGGAVKVQVFGAAADANTTFTGKNLTIVAV